MAEEKCIVLHLHEATVEGCMEAICEIFYMRVCVIRDQFSRWQAAAFKERINILVQKMETELDLPREV